MVRKNFGLFLRDIDALAVDFQPRNRQARIVAK